ncbi:Drug resistance transporter, Bcr/CflA subfamily protein [Sulfitobacter noctilucicola]|uniref:DHA1 family bicyclomycin/chloramphenicol resistance-like MFS transporter n=1 Tax=Sulfitobacter noctilucicola TaxID=1342301 RepID=A0A7W6Q3L6_9RHOB|nr:MFS transporter [Sulfitobacter noctilucicola]KIN65126.1 Drug resistance transporter, Bcr/CflA subfamily protein [Sulfitobacter noctilucicola]MBB4173738.1 DHA1 family bicyclomycin/chloramphenicol resistance-like MFS transporter [Sulfitobacter noctilucicola]
MPHSSFLMSRLEFILLIAVMFAIVAFSIDSMLPALPEIAAELTPEDANRASLILTSFVLGMGIGTFIAGPLSDAYGRRRIIAVGIGIYIVSAAVAWASSSIEVMLIARLCQGIGAAGPRIVSVAVVRDLFAGREMAKIVSVVMMVFTLIPAFAPMMGAFIIDGFGWRAIFLAFVLFASFAAIWMGLRLPETLAPTARRPMRFSLIIAALGEIFANPSVRVSILVQTLAMAMLFSILLMVQPIYYEVFDRAESFPYWFCIVGLLAGSASLLNAVLVVRLGMRFLVTATLAAQIVISSLMLGLDLASLPDPYGFAAFVVFQTGLFFQAGLTLGNLNAIAMEPMGHIAGIAASVVAAVSTTLAAALASPVGLMFDGTIQPLVAAILLFAVLGFLLMLYLGRIEKRAGL